MPRPRLLSLLTLLPALAIAQDAPATEAPANVRVSAHVVLIDRSAASRAGLEMLQVGDGRMRVARRGTGGVAIDGRVMGMPVAAFIGLARERGVVRSESRLHVVTASGSSGRIAGVRLGVDRHGLASESGPELHVVPTLLADGRIRLEVNAGRRETRRGLYGEAVGASPAMATTTVIVRPGAQATVGTIAVATERRDAGLLHWRRERSETDALIVLAAEPASR